MCKYNKDLELLRREVAGLQDKDLYGTNPEDTPLMDSFLKESARLNPLRTGERSQILISHTRNGRRILF